MGTFLKAVNKPAKEGCLFSSSFIFLRALPLGEIGLKAAIVGGQARLQSPRRLGWHRAAPAADPSRARGEPRVGGCHQTSQPTARSPGTSRGGARCNLSPDTLGCDISGALSLSQHLRLVLSDATGAGLTQGSGLYPANPGAETQIPGLEHKSKDKSGLQMPGTWSKMPQRTPFLPYHFG